MDWGFYGRRAELDRLRGIVDRGRWFFCKLSGRRRIGKTTLIQQALGTSGRAFYIQVPDSGPAGILSAARDAFETFAIDRKRFPLPATLSELATSIGQLAKAGYVVVLDEFQYFNRKHLYPRGSIDRWRVARGGPAEPDPRPGLSPNRGIRRGQKG